MVVHIHINISLNVWHNTDADMRIAMTFLQTYKQYSPVYRHTNSTDLSANPPGGDEMVDDRT
jgi:hypothetical protein